MPPKRKRGATLDGVVTNRRIRRRAATALSATAPPKNFFDLPPELRILIYDYVVQSTQSVFVRPTGSRGPQVIVNGVGSLSSASQQIRQEFSPVLQAAAYATTPHIYVMVDDFKFYSARSFVGTLVAHANMADFDLDLPSDHPTKRQFIVRMSISKAWCNSPDTKSLIEWFNTVQDNFPADSPIYYSFQNVEDRAQTTRLFDNMAAGKNESEDWENFRLYYHLFSTVGGPAEVGREIERREYQEKLGTGELGNMYESKVPWLKQELEKVMGPNWRD